MYVNTLITLQENLSTYGIDGKKITGHVTITSPGLIKCYVQNLKKQASGQTYALYAFSKAKDKGIRLGNLGSEKETKWIINEKNIKNSGINLEELDGVAIVVEDDMRGADTVLIGFKNNRYMIIPLIDDIFNKRVKPGKSAGSHEKPQPKPPVWSGNSPTKPEGHKNPTPRNEMKTGIVVEPDPLIEGIGLVIPVGPGPVILPEPGMSPQGGPGPVIPPRPGIPLQGGPGPVILPEPGMSPQGGPGPVIPPRPGIPPQGGPGPVILPEPGMSPQGGPGPVIPPRPGIPLQGGPGPVILPEPGMSHQGISQQVGYAIETEVEQNSQSGNVTAENQNNLSEEQDFTKVKIMDKKAANKVGNKIQEERMDTIDFELLKIAESLKQIGKQSSDKQEVNLGDSLNLNNPHEDSNVREDEKNNEDAVSRELQRIINMLKENQDIKQKTKGIEEQIERMRQLPQTHKLVQKSDIEKTIESRFMAQQLMGEKQEDDIEEEDADTSPKKALNFMSLEKQQIVTEKTTNQKGNTQMENLEKKENINGQDEIDYIHEMDKKIRRFEERRRQRKNNLNI